MREGVTNARQACAMAAYVVDASVAIKWLIDEPGTQQAIALRRHTLSAPDLLLPECANILWKKVRRDELSGDEAVVCARLLARADVELIPARDCWIKRCGYRSALTTQPTTACILGWRRPQADRSSPRMAGSCADWLQNLRPASR